MRSSCLHVGVQALLAHGDERGAQAPHELLRGEALHVDHDVWVELVEGVVELVELREALLDEPLVGLSVGNGKVVDGKVDGECHAECLRQVRERGGGSRSLSIWCRNSDGGEAAAARCSDDELLGGPVTRTMH